MNSWIGKVWPAMIVALSVTGSAAVAAGYRIVDLTPAGTLEASGAAASNGFQAGDITVAYYRVKCGPRKYCSVHQTHASIWSGTSATFVDLNPKGYFTSTATGLDSAVQVGFGFMTQPAYNGQEHALMWSGSARTMIDLHPAHYRDSAAYATDGGAEVGTGFVDGVGPHALRWSGSPGSVQDLNPVGVNTSEAFAIGNGREVGSGFLNGVGEHAYLWTGSAASGMDLNPAGYSSSSMLGIDSNVEVGYAYLEGQNYHAYLWNGASKKGVDLNPPKCYSSRAQGVRGRTQVGFGSFYGTPSLYAHAIAWSGTAASYVDLHRYLPASYNQSFAYGIEKNGTIMGVAYDANFKQHAILWIPNSSHSR